MCFVTVERNCVVVQDREELTENASNKDSDSE